MHKRGVIENTLVWVDSSQKETGGRDGEYTVNLVEPLRNVVGVRVLEATIPATTLSIDDENRHLSMYSIAHPAKFTTSTGIDVSPSPAKLLGVLIRRGFGEAVVTYDEDHDAQHETNVEDVAVFWSDTVDSIVPLYPSCTPVICVVPGRMADDFDGIVEFDTDSNNSVVLCSFEDGMEAGYEATVIRATYSLPRGRYDGLKDFLRELTHAYSADSTTSSTMTHIDCIKPLTSKPERSMRIKIDPTGVWYKNEQGGISYPTQERSWCAVDMSRTTAKSVLGIHSNKTTDVGGLQCVVSSDDPRESPYVVAASIVNLSAERYVWLRCPELERHMCTGVGKVLQRGIGVFRLDLPGVFKEESTEYISMVPAQFHPISRVAKLTFRFDTGSRQDQLYDFRGIDHFMLLSISVLRRDGKVVYKHLPNVLNPDYDPTESLADKASVRLQGGSVCMSEEQQREVIRIHNNILRSRSTKE